MKKRGKKKPKAPKNGKAYAQYLHIQRRSLERFNMEVSPVDFKNLVVMIQKGQGKFIRRDSNRVSIWLVDYKEKRFKVVYDKLRKSVVTILHPNKKELEL